VHDAGRRLGLGDVNGDGLGLAGGGRDPVRVEPLPPLVLDVGGLD